MKLDDFNMRGLACSLRDDADAMERINEGMARTMRGAANALELAHNRIYRIERRIEQPVPPVQKESEER